MKHMYQIINFICIPLNNPARKLSGQCYFRTFSKYLNKFRFDNKLAVS